MHAAATDPHEFTNEVEALFGKRYKGNFSSRGMCVGSAVHLGVIFLAAVRVSARFARPSKAEWSAEREKSHAMIMMAVDRRKEERRLPMQALPGSGKRWSPGCVNAVGKARQKW